MKFPPGSIVRHTRGGRYEIIGLGMMERDLEVVYVYRDALTGALWVRSPEQMEDGRFELEAKR